ncbi:MAG: hypothetical protein P3W87_000205 [Gammaproteobacteria bacterium]|nr:hypothetical protein [Gammaproteobacteria bacterium]
MTDSKSIEDIAEDLWSVPETIDINEEALKAKAPLNKDARRRLEDLMEERRLKKAIEDDYFD